MKARRMPIRWYASPLRQAEAALVETESIVPDSCSTYDVVLITA